jgi:hypothetical protein
VRALEHALVHADYLLAHSKNVIRTFQTHSYMFSTHLLHTNYILITYSVPQNSILVRYLIHAADPLEYVIDIR